MLVATAIKGKGAMPPKGGNASLSDDEVARAVVFMANQSGAKLQGAGAKRSAPRRKPARPGRSRAKPRGGGRQEDLRQHLHRLPRQRASRARRSSATRPRGHRASSRAWTRSAVGAQGQGRDAAERRQHRRSRTPNARRRRVHGLASQIGVGRSASLHRRSARVAQGVQGLERRDDARRAGARPRDLGRASRTSSALDEEPRHARAPRALSLTDNDEDWYRAHETRGRARSTDFDAVLMRKDPPFDMEYVRRTWLLERRSAKARACSTRRDAIRDHNEKLAIARVPAVHRADAGHARAAARSQAFIDEHRDVILKPLDGMGGDGHLPRARRRPEPQRDRRDDGASAARAR